MNNPATLKCSNRLFEWSCAIIMVQLGLLTWFSELVLHSRPQLAFTAFLDLGMSPTAIGLMFFVVGGARCVALWRNSKWKNSSGVRAVCAVVGAVIWGQLFFGIIQVFVKTGDVYLTWAVWSTFVVMEGISFRRALADQKHYPAVLESDDASR